MDRGTRIYFIANACHVCKSKNTLYKCEVCSMIFYCSLEHRRDNWLDHSQLCWALKKVVPEGHLFEAFKGGNFTAFKHEVAKKCIGWLRRGLKPWEFEMIYHPRICEICKEHDWEKLKRCEGCEFIYTCEQHNSRKDHSKWCKVFKLYSDIITEDSLSSLKIQNLLKEEISISNRKKSMMAILQNSNNKDHCDVKKALLSELLTYPLTVLNSLATINANTKKQVAVMFIGAEIQAEVEPLEKWEKYLLHFIENVNVLTLIFLGPELRADIQEYTLDLCKECRLKQKSLRCEFVSGKLYHEYETKAGIKPDIICALNSGMYRDFGFSNENSWQDTIHKLFARDSPPVLITEYTCHELNQDLEKIKTLCGDITFISQLKMNPYASLKPGLNIISETETPVIFKNYYHAILQKA